MDETLRNILHNALKESICQVITNRIRDAAIREEMNGLNDEEIVFIKNKFYQKQLQAILDKNVTEDMCEFQKAMLFIQNKDARLELRMGDYHTDKYEMENPNHELAQYERQQYEAHRFIQNYRRMLRKQERRSLKTKRRMTLWII